MKIHQNFCVSRVNRPGDRVNIIEHEERDSCVPNESEFDKFKANAVLI